MARRHLLKPDEQVALFDVPTDEESLIRQYTLSGEDLKFALSKAGTAQPAGLRSPALSDAPSRTLPGPRRAGTRSDGRLHRQPAERGGNGVR